MSLAYVDLFHDCDPPRLPEEGSHGLRGQVMARWKCSECGQVWRLKAQFMESDVMAWERVWKPSRKWLQAERKRRLAAALATPAEKEEA